uniref:CCT domain-containing protein n=1 Tax=Arundo donax TaxID=35708 RepID=A0A0A9GYA5_ARUDO
MVFITRQGSQITQSQQEMYQPVHFSSCYGVDGDTSYDPILPSRPDALLANGASFLPSSYYSQSQQGLVGPARPCSQQQVQSQVIPLSSPTSSAMAAAASSFRRVSSTGDLLREEEEQRVVAPAGRYSAVERQERIDKYRSKRNQRNFQKKITYACRKTLADSRPRVKGRFARNNDADYTGAEADPVQVSGTEYSESPPVKDVHVECDGNMMMMMMNADMVNGKDNHSRSGTSTLEWWPVMQEALATGVDLDNLCDEEILAAYLGVSSISLYSPSYSPSASGQ